LEKGLGKGSKPLLKDKKRLVMLVKKDIGRGLGEGGCLLVRSLRQKMNEKKYASKSVLRHSEKKMYDIVVKI
jgi:hypothetical protein